MALDTFNQEQKALVDVAPYRTTCLCDPAAVDQHFWQPTNGRPRVVGSGRYVRGRETQATFTGPTYTDRRTRIASGRYACVLVTTTYMQDDVSILTPGIPRNPDFLPKSPADLDVSRAHRAWVERTTPSALTTTPRTGRS
jgi:hypothetical protein